MPGIRVPSTAQSTSTCTGSGGSIRRVMPNFSGLDISPIIAFIAIFFIQQIIFYYVYPAVIRAGI